MMSLLTWVGPAARMQAGLFFVLGLKRGASAGTGFGGRRAFGRQRARDAALVADDTAGFVRMTECGRRRPQPFSVIHRTARIRHGRQTRTSHVRRPRCIVTEGRKPCRAGLLPGMPSEGNPHLAAGAESAELVRIGGVPAKARNARLPSTSTRRARPASRRVTSGCTGGTRRCDTAGNEGRHRRIGRGFVAKRRAPHAKPRKTTPCAPRAAAHNARTRCPPLLAARVLRRRKRVPPRATPRPAGPAAVSYLRKRLS
ncbi:hypothetical protein K6W55_22130 [Burkholderia dolosa]|nr:hypothetical protein [Burkholderia dolosa]MBY4832926.1 hypothetical protein [Burkholderia dolosa]